MTHLPTACIVTDHEGRAFLSLDAPHTNPATHVVVYDLDTQRAIEPYTFLEREVTGHEVLDLHYRPDADAPTPATSPVPALNEEGKRIATLLAAFFGETDTDRHASLASWLVSEGVYVNPFGAKPMPDTTEAEAAEEPATITWATIVPANTHVDEFAERWHADAHAHGRVPTVPYPTAAAVHVLTGDVRLEGPVLALPADDETPAEEETAPLARQRSVFVHDGPTGTDDRSLVSFASLVSDDDPTIYRYLDIAPDVWEGMGRPESVTVTVEPGDLLNAEEPELTEDAPEDAPEDGPAEAAEEPSLAALFGGLLGDLTGLALDGLIGALIAPPKAPTEEPAEEERPADRITPEDASLDATLAAVKDRIEPQECPAMVCACKPGTPFEQKLALMRERNAGTTVVVNLTGGADAATQARTIADVLARGGNRKASV